MENTKKRQLGRRLAVQNECPVCDHFHPNLTGNWSKPFLKHLNVHKNAILEGNKFSQPQRKLLQKATKITEIIEILSKLEKGNQLFLQYTFFKVYCSELTLIVKNSRVQYIWAVIKTS